MPRCWRDVLRSHLLPERSSETARRKLDENALRFTMRAPGQVGVASSKDFLTDGEQVHTNRYQVLEEGAKLPPILHNHGCDIDDHLPH